MELWSLGDSEHVGRALAEAARRRGWTINRLARDGMIWDN